MKNIVNLVRQTRKIVPTKAENLELVVISNNKSISDANIVLENRNKDVQKKVSF